MLGALAFGTARVGSLRLFLLPLLFLFSVLPAAPSLAAVVVVAVVVVAVVVDVVVVVVVVAAGTGLQ